MLPAPPPSAPDAALPPPPAPSAGGTAEPTAVTATPVGRSSARVTWTLAGLTAVGCAYVAVADPNASASWYPDCPFRAVTGLDCPGCGMTRALHALLTGHPLRALDHNVLLVTAFAVAVVWFAWSRVRAARGRPPLQWRGGVAVAIGLGALVMGFWVVRNLPWGPFEWLASGASGA